MPSLPHASSSAPALLVPHSSRRNSCSVEGEPELGEGGQCLGPEETVYAPSSLASSKRNLLLGWRRRRAAVLQCGQTDPGQVCSQVEMLSLLAESRHSQEGRRGLLGAQALQRAWSSCLGHREMKSRGSADLSGGTGCLGHSQPGFLKAGAFRKEKEVKNKNKQIRIPSLCLSRSYSFSRAQ